MKDGPHSLRGIRTDSLGEEAQQGHSSSVRTRAPHSLHTPENSPAPAGHGSVAEELPLPPPPCKLLSSRRGEKRGGDREGGLTPGLHPDPRSPIPDPRAEPAIQLSLPAG